MKFESLIKAIKRLALQGLLSIYTLMDVPLKPTEESNIERRTVDISNTLYLGDADELRKRCDLDPSVDCFSTTSEIYGFSTSDVESGEDGKPQYKFKENLTDKLRGEE